MYPMLGCDENMGAGLVYHGFVLVSPLKSQGTQMQNLHLSLSLSLSVTITLFCFCLFLQCKILIGLLKMSVMSALPRGRELMRLFKSSTDTGASIKPTTTMHPPETSGQADRGSRRMGKWVIMKSLPNTAVMCTQTLLTPSAQIRQR